MSRKNSGSCVGSCLGTMIEMIIMIPFLPFMLVLSCAKDYKPMNSKGRKISRAKTKKWF